MKKRILALGVVLALVAVMALPMAVFAADVSGTTAVTGNLAQTFTLIPPATFGLGSTPGTLALGPNAGSSPTPGSVVTNAAGWTLSVSDTKTPHAGYMTILSGGPIGQPLADAIQIGTTAPAAGTALGTIAAYDTALQTATYGLLVGPGTGNTFSIPLYANQTVEATDAAGAYSITLTYVASPAS